jgi:hypothetical protein
MPKQWNFVPTNKRETGYDDIMDSLRNYYTHERFIAADELGQQRLIDEVFEIYNQRKIFPVNYYNEEGVHEEILKVVNRDVEFDGKVLNNRLNQGQSLCRFLMPNLFDVQARGEKSPFERFNTEKELKRSISFAFKYDTNVTPVKVFGGLRLTSSVATNFKTMYAKAIFEHFTPENGTVFDFSCGFGGRMLGALSSKKNLTYLGVEPATETFNNLNTLGKHIEKATGRENIFKIVKKGSEDVNLPENSIDFAFSSPPYFDLEVYSDEETQCYNRYPSLEDWFEGYVRLTIRNIYKALKPNSYYAVNIADFKIGSKHVQYVQKWIDISIEEGFTFDREIAMQLQRRRGSGHTEKANAPKKEGIFVFKK